MACGRWRKSTIDGGSWGLSVAPGQPADGADGRVWWSSACRGTRMKDQSNNAIVVGGGIAGLFAGLLLAEAGRHSVHLVERDTRLGGLLRSTRYRGESSYDTGIHYGIETGNPKIDSVLFEGMSGDKWHVFNTSLPQGNVFGGRLNSSSGCIDARTLDPQLYARGLVELLDGQEAEEDVPHLAEALEAEYGPTFTEHIFRPVMRKLAGRALEQLAPSAHGGFGISRLIVVPSRAAKRLKILPEYDRCIAYTKTLEGRSPIQKFYPRNGGIGRWPELLTRKLAGAGARMHVATKIDAVTTENGRITSVTLSDGQRLPCDLLVWTVPLPLLARALGTGVPGTAPAFRHVLLLHYLFRNKGVTPGLHWVTIYDEDAVSYRVTLYDNIAPGNDSDGSRVTVETLWSECPQNIEDIAEQVKSELGDLGLVDDSRSGEFMGHEWVANAFPLRLAGQRIEARTPEVIDRLSNLVVAGRGVGTAFSQPEILEAILTGVECQIAD